MRATQCFIGSLLVFGVLSFAPEVDAQTQTQTPLTCTRTVDVIGDGFTLDCDVADAGTPAAADFTVRRVRRYESFIDEAPWLYFDIVAGIDYDSFRLPVIFHYADGTFLECTEFVPEMKTNEVEEGLVIPGVCGPDLEWSAAEFVSPTNFTCSGCGVYQFDDLPTGRAIPPGASDSALELERVIADYELQAQQRQ